MSTYTAVTDADRETMLSAIGVEDVEDLFAVIPADLRLDHPLDLPPGAPEQDVYAHLRDLAARNVSTEDELSFLGGGMYDHYVPAIVDMLMSRSEFLTPYTPYQPEVSQGGLQVMFEYQTAISELTALPVANASVYDGPSAVASAGYLARLANRRTRFVVSEGLHPHARETLRTYAHGFGARDHRGAAARRRAPTRMRGRRRWTTTRARRSSRTPTSSAPSRTRPPWRPRCRTPASSSAPTTRSRSASCARRGSAASTSCVGEGQPLGNRLDFGGPSFGFFAATEEYLRRMPGRIAGETVTPRAGAASCSRCRRASSTSAARRRRRTSAPRRRSTRWAASST